MSSDPLPDHYKALGVDKTADATAIKAVYRKLVLKCHPDKVTDPTLKEQKQEEFHKIQEAYEVLVDDQKRSDYEAHLTLEALRKEKAARTANADKNARFDVRTPGGSSYVPSGSSRYATEERKPSRAYDDDDRYYDDRTRSKYDTYPAYPKTGSSPRSGRADKDSPSKSSRPAASDRTRSERTKTRDREARNDRKFVSVESESSSDEKARYETEYKRRSAEVEARKAADSRRKAEDRRSYEEPRYVPSTSRKMSAQEEEAIRYQHKSRTQVEADMGRPSIPRTSSRDYFPEARSSRKDSRPETVRRSSARPKERQPSSARIVPEIVDWSEHRSPPSFKQSSSSPANIEIPRAMPSRSHTDMSREYRPAEATSPPSFQRSTTMPSVHAPSSRRKESTARPSGLREAMTPELNGAEQDGFPFIPPPQTSSAKTKYYHYPAPGGSAAPRQEDMSHRTILREPERHRHRSPSPLTRPPIGPNRPSELSTPPAFSRANTSRHLSPARGEDRGRLRPSLYGEVGGSRGRQSSFNPGSVQFSRKYGPEDVKWAPKSQENEREYANKPTLGRTATYVY